MAFSALRRSRRAPPRLDHVVITAVLLLALAGPLGGGHRFMRLLVASADSLLDARSPGPRAGAQLVKQPRPAKRAARALPRIRLPLAVDPEPLPMISDDMPPFQALALNTGPDLLIALDPEGADLASLTAELPRVAPWMAGGVTGGPALFVPPPSSLGPISAIVPEPDAWALSITGFGLIGWRARRRPRRASAHAG